MHDLSYPERSDPHRIGFSPLYQLPVFQKCKILYEKLKSGTNAQKMVHLNFLFTTTLYLFFVFGIFFNFFWQLPHILENPFLTVNLRKEPTFFIKTD